MLNSIPKLVVPPTVRCWMMVENKEKTISSYTPLSLTSDTKIGPLLFLKEVHHSTEVPDGILPSHLPQHAIAAWLNWHVQEGIHSWMLHDLRHVLQGEDKVGLIYWLKDLFYSREGYKDGQTRKKRHETGLGLNWFLQYFVFSFSNSSYTFRWCKY